MRIYNIINIPKGLSPENECDCQGEYNSGYTAGYQEGVEDQKSKLSFIVITGNGEYTREDGFSAVSVNVSSSGEGYDSGYTDGFADGYDSGRTDGWQPAYNSGYTDGLNAAGGDYASGYTDGWGSGYDSGYTDGLNACSGGTGNEDLIANLQGDYFLIPEGTTHLRDYAFSYCEISPSVSAFTIPDSVTGIGKDAFGNFKGVQSITIPDSVTELSQRAFYASSPTHIILGSGLTALPNTCFSSSKNLIDITIHSGITTIGSSCFNLCNGLTAITFESLTPPELVGGTCLGSSAQTFPFFVPCEAVDTYKTAWSAFPYYVNRITCGSSEKPRRIIMELDNPLVISGETSFTTEPADAYLPTPTYYSEDETIATVDSAGTVTVVSEGTVRISANFKYGNATLIASKEIQTRLTPVPPVPSGVSVLDFVYETTEPDQEIILFHGEAQVDNQFFYTFYSGITEMVIDGNTVQKDENNIQRRSGSSVYDYIYEFPSAGRHNVKYYVSKTMSAHTDTGYYFPGFWLDGVMFCCDIPLVEANVGSDYTALKTSVFATNSNLTAVTLPDTLEYIGSTTFAYTNITNLVIPDSVIGAYSSSYIDVNGPEGLCENCQYLTSITFGSGLTKIGNNNISGCSNIQEVTFRATTPPTLQTNAINTRLGTDTFPIYVPASAVETYKTAWPAYASRIQAITD